MLDAVKADLAKIDVGAVPGGCTFEAMALWLADVIDKRGTDDGPSTTAKLADQLTKVMRELTRKGDEGAANDFRVFTESLSTPAFGG